MTKIDIFSGFLGAGKTTLIKKLIKEAYAGEKLVLIENEFGEIGVDGGFLQSSGIEITEMNSGCICCSLVGDFSKALSEVFDKFHPDRVIIEPSGVGKLSDVIRAVKGVETDEAKLNCFTVVVDAGKCKMYMKNFGEFFNDQIENASTVIFSHTDVAKAERIEEAVKLVREHNSDAIIVTTPLDQICGKEILAAMKERNTLEKELLALEEHHRHHHEHHDHDEHCSCGCHEHEEHEHHREHHDHDEHCTCGCHGHGHHHADEVFSSFGVETAKVFSKEELERILSELDESDEYGIILRAKGIVASSDGKWIHFDYVPGEINIRYGTASVIGRLCVIGSGIKNDKIKELLGV